MKTEELPEFKKDLKKLLDKYKVSLGISIDDHCNQGVSGSFVVGDIGGWNEVVLNEDSLSLDASDL